MAAGDLKNAYAASSNLVVTNLHSLPTSATWTAGWASAVIDNSTNKHIEMYLSGKITVAAASVDAGFIYLYTWGLLDDTPTYHDLIDGTEGTVTIDAEVRDGFMKFITAIATDTAVDEVYHFGPIGLAGYFGGTLPDKFGIFIAHSTGANLAAAGNQVTIKGAYQNVAQS